MELKIAKLVEKYWLGETSLEEEKAIKDHFRSSHHLGMESDYFRYLEAAKSSTYSGPKKVAGKKKWLPVAATISVGILAALLVINEANKDPYAINDPEKALKATKEALMMVSNELNEGQSHTMELVKINKVKDEFQEE